jgi:pimeloyl-ACP methyl ester carboxylesterase
MSALREKETLNHRQGSDWVWPEYYREFDYFSEAVVRSGCHPRKMVHKNTTGRSIVLIHGLTDSPFFLTAIGEYFHTCLGYNVYLPLLQCHGLKDPGGMVGVSLSEWKRNVRFAIRTAQSLGGRVSLGGLSAGGALSFYMACREPEVDGDLYLFSPALGLYGDRFGVVGRLKEIILRLGITRYFDSRRPLVGDHPYRYERVTYNSAEELAVLIRENQRFMAELGRNNLPPRRIFTAWTECDRVVSLERIEVLEQIVGNSLFTSYIIPEKVGVKHACVVLKEPVYAVGAGAGQAPLEDANPYFAQMMETVSDFATCREAESVESFSCQAAGA